MTEDILVSKPKEIGGSLVVDWVNNGVYTGGQTRPGKKIEEIRCVTNVFFICMISVLGH